MCAGRRALEEEAGEQLLQICGGADMYRTGNESFVISVRAPPLTECCCCLLLMVRWA